MKTRRRIIPKSRRLTAKRRRFTTKRRRLTTKRRRFTTKRRRLMKGGVSEWDNAWSSTDFINMINNREKDKHDMLKQENIELIYRLQVKYTKSPEKRCRDMQDIIKKIENQTNTDIKRNLQKLLYIINNLARYKISTNTRDLGNISPMSSTNEMVTTYAECSSLNMPEIDETIAPEVKKKIMQEYGNSYTVNKGRYNEERIKPEDFFPEVIIT